MRFSSAPSPRSRRVHRPAPEPGAAPERGAAPEPAAWPRLRVVDDDAYPDWESVYRDNVERLYRLMAARVGNRPDAEDLTAEVFRAALNPLRLGSSRGEVRAYLLLTAGTVLASYWRRQLGHPAVTLVDPETDLVFLADPPVDGGSGAAAAQAREILDALPDRYRRILELRFLEGASIKEAARIMDVTVGNAKVLQHRALQMAGKVGPGPGGRP